MERIFISHGRDQAHFAQALAATLADSGLQPWLAMRDVEPGQALAQAIREAAESSDGAVLLLGSQEPSSWVRTEWSLLLDAHWRSKLGRLVAVLLDDAAAPGFLREARVLRASSAPETWEETMGQVVTTLRQEPAPTEADESSRERLRERFESLAAELQQLEPGDEDLLRLSRDLRNFLVHVGPTDLSPSDRARVLQQLAMLEIRFGNSDEAERLLLQAVALLASDEPSEQSASAHYNLGVVLLSRGDFEAARNVFDDAFRESRRSAGEAHPLTAAAAYNLGFALARLGRTDEASTCYESAIRAGSESLGPDHETVRTYRKALEGLAG